MDTKICTRCSTEKNKSEFSKRKVSRDGLRSQCKSCDAMDVLNNKERHAKSLKENYVKNRKRILEYHKKRQETMPELVRGIKKKSREKHKGKYKIAHLKKMSNDELYAFRDRLRKLIGISSRKGYTTKSTAFKVLGCEHSFFVQYIESQFSDGMTWSNIHIDHIKPISKAKTKEELIELFHYSNCQPLFAIDNILKGVRIMDKQLRFL